MVFVILSATKDLKHNSNALTFSTVPFIVLCWLQILHFV